MGTVILYLALALNAVVAVFVPWVGVVVTYLVAVLTPQNIWWWSFEGIRPVYWALVPTLAGFALAVATCRVRLAPLASSINLWVLVIYAAGWISYLWGPYVDVVNEFRFYEPAVMFEAWQKSMVAYFVATLLIDSPRKLKPMASIMVITILYMTWWANAQYFLEGKFGRIHGPIALDGSSIYGDENNFAALFVVGFPFLYWFGRYVRSRLLRYAAWAAIPFAWHAVFLTASRGALLGIVAVMLVHVMRSERKLVALAAAALFAVAFAWQAGDVMRARSSTIVNYEEEHSAASRIDAWSAALGMMADHPFTGVGFASFGQAFPDYSPAEPRIAHNTFFQLGGESGVLAGLAYLFLMLSTFGGHRAAARILRAARHDRTGEFLFCLNEACLLATTGFFVCALFLSLEKYEILYYLLVLSNATLLCAARIAPAASARPEGGPAPFAVPGGSGGHS